MKKIVLTLVAVSSLGLATMSPAKAWYDSDTAAVAGLAGRAIGAMIGAAAASQPTYYYPQTYYVRRTYYVPRTYVPRLCWAQNRSGLWRQQYCR